MLFVTGSKWLRTPPVDLVEGLRLCRGDEGNTMANNRHPPLSCRGLL
jgi:hypothetical protein